MFIKVFLAAVAVPALLGCIGANRKENKRLAAVIALVALILFTVVMVSGSSKKEEDKPTAVAPESGKITAEQNQWGTITVTDETGVTREYQGCIRIDGTYPYETYEFMGLCVSMDNAITIGEWSPGLYKLYYENEEAYWKMIEEKKQTEKEKTQNE